MFRHSISDFHILQLLHAPFVHLFLSLMVVAIGVWGNKREFRLIGQSNLEFHWLIH